MTIDPHLQQLRSMSSWTIWKWLRMTLQLQFPSFFGDKWLLSSESERLELLTPRSRLYSLSDTIKFAHDPNISAGIVWVRTESMYKWNVLSYQQPHRDLQRSCSLGMRQWLYRAAVQSYHGLLAVRVMLGITEAVFFRGVIHFMSTWYTRSELGKRLGALFIFQMLDSAFGGFIAAACLPLDGRYGISGWRWLFIVCVQATIVWIFLLTDLTPVRVLRQLIVDWSLPCSPAQTHRTGLCSMAHRNGGWCWWSSWRDYCVERF